MEGSTPTRGGSCRGTLVIMLILTVLFSGAMSTWGHDELMSKAVYMAAHPECGPAEVGEIFPESFRQLQVFRNWGLSFEFYPESFRQICMFFLVERLRVGMAWIV